MVDLLAADLFTSWVFFFLVASETHFPPSHSGSPHWHPWRKILGGPIFLKITIAGVFLCTCMPSVCNVVRVRIVCLLLRQDCWLMWCDVMLWFQCLGSPQASRVCICGVWWSSRCPGCNSSHGWWVCYL
jgi:hypothetical protein